MFAKLYGSDSDQVLATIEQDDNGAETVIRVRCRGRSPVAFAEVDLAYQSEKRLKKAWDALDEARARQVLEPTMKALKAL